MMDVNVYIDGWGDPLIVFNDVFRVPSCPLPVQMTYRHIGQHSVAAVEYIEALKPAPVGNPDAVKLIDEYKRFYDEDLRVRSWNSQSISE